MKKLSFFSKSIALGMFLFVALTACQKEELSNQVDFATETPVAKTYEAKVIQQTTNVIVSMLNENPALFNNIDEAIKSDAVEYMEDRILFADLFKNPQLVKSVDEQTQLSTFSTNFRKHASSTIQYAPAYGQEQSSMLDADALMQYLEDNNISIYCPFPLEDYAEDNRIPAIAANIGEEYVELPGIQFYADGSFDSVMVSQAYADLHPVWLINQEEKYIFEEQNQRNKILQNKVTILPYPGPIVSPSEKHYEVKISSVYLTNYYGGISEGDIDLRLCFSSTNPQYNTSEECFKGYFDRIINVQMPRSYVKYAKLGYDKGWFNVDVHIDGDWATSELQKYFASYDYDPKGENKEEHTYNTYYKVNASDIADLGLGGETGESYNAKITISYKTNDDLITFDTWDRAFIFDRVLKQGDAKWITDDNTILNTALDGNYMIKPSTDLLIAVYSVEY